MKFKPAQEITPKNKRFKIVFGQMIPEDKMPKFGKVYTVMFYPFGGSSTHPKRNYMLLEELPFALFHEDSFEALIPTDHLEDLLNEVDHDLKEIKKLADG